MTIPAFVNPGAGSSNSVLKALAEAPSFALRPADQRGLPAALREAVAKGAPRVLVAGGDGTIALAGSVLAGTAVALAVLPAGTRNHFARDHRIPNDAGEALRLAVEGSVRPVDVGYVNDTLFVNTSSVGVYVRFVRTRERIEPALGYWLASLLAGLRMLASRRRMAVKLELPRGARVYRAPLVFVGVGERNLALPGLGQLVADGTHALHVVIPRGRRQARRFTRAYARINRGLAVDAPGFGLDSALVEGFRLELGKGSIAVAVDGEIKRLRAPLDYRLDRGALNLVAP